MTIQHSKTSWSLTGAIAASIAASICCLGPLVLLALGVGGAWASSLTRLEPYRPIFMALALGFLALAFYRAYRTPKGEACAPDGSCTVPGSTRINRIVLWIIAPLLVAMLLLPYFAPRLFAGSTPKGATPMQTEQAVFKVEGMHCSACPVTVRNSLTQVDGVQDAKVTLDPPQAVVTYDPAKTSVQAIEQATTKAGYPSSVKQ